MFNRVKLFSVFILVLFAATQFYSPALLMAKDRPVQEEVTLPGQDPLVVPAEEKTVLPEEKEFVEREFATKTEVKSEAKEKVKEEAKEKEPVKVGWDKYPPQVTVTKWDEKNTRIQVVPYKKMTKEERLGIIRTRLMLPDDKTLGVRSFYPGEDARDAEFMIEHAKIKDGKVKIMVSSRTDGDWVKVLDLNAPEVPKAEASTSQIGKDEKSKIDKVLTESLAPAKKEAPKKKGWFW